MSLLIERSTDLKTCLALRHEVFVIEQNVSLEEEQDGLDPEAVHFLASIDGAPVGTLRILIKGDTGKIGRICVVQSARGTGCGASLVRSALAYLSTVPDVTRAMLGSQEHAIGFYERLGFVAFGPTYMDAGIPHRDMERLI